MTQINLKEYEKNLLLNINCNMHATLDMQQKYNLIVVAIDNMENLGDFLQAAHEDDLLTNLFENYGFTGTLGESFVFFSKYYRQFIMVVGTKIKKNKAVDFANNFDTHAHMCYQLGVDLDTESIKKYRLIGKEIVNNCKQYVKEECKVALLDKDFNRGYHMLEGLLRYAFDFKQYFTNINNKNLKKFNLNCVDFVHPEIDEFKQNRLVELKNLYEGVNLTKKVVTEPSNIIFPKSFARVAQHVFENLKICGVKIKILEEDELKNLGFNALLGVGKGSSNRPCVLVVEYAGNPQEDAWHALVGKGVTFDSGGISLKPGDGMEEMKYDMAGAGAVLGAMYALATNNVKKNVVGVMGLVENMPDAAAQKPGDVVVSLSGQSVEIINTDAEGRLVLADLVTYAQNNYQITHLIDLATLTGAVKVALGPHYAGFCCNNGVLSRVLQQSGFRVGEQLWPLPFGKEYDWQIDSKIADMVNVGNGNGAGSSIGAQFVSRFVKNSVAWAHVDIANVAWNKLDKLPLNRGASAFGVNLIFDLFKNI